VVDQKREGQGPTLRDIIKTAFPCRLEKEGWGGRREGDSLLNVLEESGRGRREEDGV